MEIREARMAKLKEDIALCKAKIKQACDIDWLIIYDLDNQVSSDAGLGQSEIIILYAQIMAKLQTQLNLEILDGN
jgi:hypothetical protein